jgi:DNA polymerase-3 subunit alpha
MAKKIEGNARHISVHAAGVVISPIPLTEIVPLQLDPKGEGQIITQYDMHAVGEDGVGLLKMDFLGLKNLTLLEKALALIEKEDKMKFLKKVIGYLIKEKNLEPILNSSDVLMKQAVKI